MGNIVNQQSTSSFYDLHGAWMPLRDIARYVGLAGKKLEQRARKQRKHEK